MRGPRGASPRLHGLDVARGLAVLGMVIVNVGPADATGLLHRLYMLPYGRASVLFVVVAGIGMGYFLSRRRGAGLWPSLPWRVAVLLLLGLTLQTLTDSVSVILETYALLFLIAPLLARLPTRWLLGTGAALMVLGPSAIILRGEAEPGLLFADTGATWTTPPAEAWDSLLLTGPYPLVSWTVPFIAGLLLARVDLRDRTLRWRLLLWGAVATVGAQLASTLAYQALGPAADDGPLRLLTGVAHGQMPLWLISSIGGAAVTIVLSLVVAERWPWSVDWLRRCGLLAFTLYVVHIPVIALAEPAAGFTLAQGMLVALLINAGCVLLAVLWTRTGLAGPFEWLLRHPFFRPERRQGPASQDDTREETVG